MIIFAQLLAADLAKFTFYSPRSQTLAQIESSWQNAFQTWKSAHWVKGPEIFRFPIYFKKSPHLPTYCVHHLHPNQLQSIPMRQVEEIFGEISKNFTS